MLNGTLKKGEKNILEVGQENYRITDELSKRIKIKNILLVLETVTLTFIYLLSIEKYRDIPFNGISKDLMKGLNITFLFILLVTAGFISTSMLLLPEDIENHVEELE